VHPARSVGGLWVRSRETPPKARQRSGRVEAQAGSIRALVGSTPDLTLEKIRAALTERGVVVGEQIPPRGWFGMGHIASGLAAIDGRRPRALRPRAMAR
jgi:hypothetical protein